MNISKYIALSCVFAVGLMTSCSDDDNKKDNNEIIDPVTPPADPDDTFTRLLGGDISMLSAYQDYGVVYKDIDGKTIDVLPFFKEQGMNAMRVRLFVDPYSELHEKGVIQNLEYVNNLAVKIKEAGFKFMLDFHYSDYWADPAQQYIPSSWKSLDTKGLTEKLYSYTKEVLTHLNTNNVAPDLIQIGNEISYGMLWKNGKVNYSSKDNWDVFTNMLKNASKACRETLPDAKIILHIERTDNANQCVSFVNYMKQYNVDYDIIGLSYYPIWHNTLTSLNNTLTTIEKATDKKIMIVEFGYNYNWYPSDAKYDESTIGYKGNAEGQKNITKALVAMLNTHSNVTGLFWWFPEENECCTAGYTGLLEGWTNRGLFDNATGKALPALYELKAFKTTNN